MLTEAFDKGYAAGELTAPGDTKPTNPYARRGQARFNAWEYGFHHGQQSKVVRP